MSVELFLVSGTVLVARLVSDLEADLISWIPLSFAIRARLQ